VVFSFNHRQGDRSHTTSADATSENIVLPATRYPQRSRQVVAGQCVDAGNVGRGESTGDSDDRAELVERGPVVTFVGETGVRLIAWANSLLAASLFCRGERKTSMT
jgi:hypothetical protein